MSLNPCIPQWSGRRVWLIGASTGIGRATAELLHSKGAKVIASARSREALHALASQCPGLEVLPLDVTDPASVHAAAVQLHSTGPLDLMMYCAGTYAAQRAQDLQVTDITQHMRVNYLGAVHSVAAVLPAMLAAKQGHISLVSSVAGFRGLPKSLAYGPTKAALINLAETLYIDLHDEGLGVSIINPGFVKTPLTAQNSFHMPALISPAQAAIEIVNDWERGKFEIHFPKRFTLWMKLLRIVPYSWYFRATRRFTGL
ncbi:MAG: SDR family NAD(P)-dependent oxidoreductase [Burkholderiaceae bacterium]